jgi:hypothetical protein
VVWSENVNLDVLDLSLNDITPDFYCGALNFDFNSLVNIVTFVHRVNAKYLKQRISNLIEALQ